MHKSLAYHEYPELPRGSNPATSGRERKVNMDKEKMMEEIILEKISRLPDFQKGRIIGIMETLDDKNMLSGLKVDREGNITRESERLAELA